ncbi:phosphatase PAP2 family protein [Microbacterium sp. NPDC091313]
MPTLTRPDARRRTAGVIALVCALAFVSLRFTVVAGGRAPLPVDTWWDELMLSILSPVGVVAAWVPAIVGGTIGMIVLGVVGVAAFAWRRRPWDAASLGLSIAVVVAIGAPMAAVIARLRPSESLAESVPTSFPSGHTAVATASAVALGLIFRRGWVWVVGITWALTMAVSRTYLHAHWLTDVVAGLLEGATVATLVWCILETIREKRALSRVSDAPDDTAQVLPAADAGQ